jgi:hypothetical protein
MMPPVATTAGIITLLALLALVALAAGQRGAAPRLTHQVAVRRFSLIRTSAAALNVAQNANCCE